MPRVDTEETRLTGKSHRNETLCALVWSGGQIAGREGWTVRFLGLRTMFWLYGSRCQHKSELSGIYCAARNRCASKTRPRSTESARQVPGLPAPLQCKPPGKQAGVLSHRPLGKGRQLFSSPWRGRLPARMAWFGDDILFGLQLAMHILSELGYKPMRFRSRSDRQ